MEKLCRRRLPHKIHDCPPDLRWQRTDTVPYGGLSPIPPGTPCVPLAPLAPPHGTVWLPWIPPHPPTKRNSDTVPMRGSRGDGLPGLKKHRGLGSRPPRTARCRCVVPVPPFQTLSVCCTRAHTPALWPSGGKRPGGNGGGMGGGEPPALPRPTPARPPLPTHPCPLAPPHPPPTPSHPAPPSGPGRPRKGLRGGWDGGLRQATALRI